jgi:hypothetical protein
MKTALADQVVKVQQSDGTSDVWYWIALDQYNATDIAIGIDHIFLTGTFNIYRSENGFNEDITTLYRSYDPTFTNPAGEVAMTKKRVNITNLGAPLFGLKLSSIVWGGVGGLFYVSAFVVPRY